MGNNLRSKTTKVRDYPPQLRKASDDVKVAIKKMIRVNKQEMEKPEKRPIP